MKKISKTLSLMLALMLLCAALPMALAEGEHDEALATELPEPEMVILGGIVLEVTDEYLLLQTADSTQVQANLFDETLYSTAGAVKPGDYVEIGYSGIMTFSLPGQIAAMSVTSYQVSGTVGEIADEGFLLTDLDGGEWMVRVPEDATIILSEGMDITVYYNGMMTRSLPPQINALHLRGNTISGTVSAVEEGSFLLTDESGEEQIIHFDATTAVCTALEDGAEVIVMTSGIMAPSLPAQFFAMEILPAASEDETEAETKTITITD